MTFQFCFPILVEKNPKFSSDMGDLRKLIKWMFAVVVVAFIQQKSANIFGGKFTNLFPSVDLRSLPLASRSLVRYLPMDSTTL